MIKSQKLQLLHHPKNPPVLNNAVTVELATKENKLQLIYTLHNPQAGLLIPPPARPVKRDKLWQHTCCEAFLGLIDQSDYLEFNFSPSGEWVAYAFSNYREQCDWQNPPTPDISIMQTDSTLRLEAIIRLDTLPAAFQNQPLELGISTVLEDKQRNIAYLALTHATENPDFHRRDQWIRLGC